MNLFRRLFGRRKLINIPEVCGPRLCRSELVAAMHGSLEDPKVRALLQILAAQRTQCLDAASDDAYKGQDSRYQLGGLEALDDVFTMVTMLATEGKVHDSLMGFFDATD